LLVSGQVEAFHDLAALPAPVGGMLGPKERIPAGGDVAEEHTAYGRPLDAPQIQRGTAQ
jgi:hypothetical protein